MQLTITHQGFVALAALLLGCVEEGPVFVGDDAATCTDTAQGSSLDGGKLEQGRSEQAWLMYVREREKLARDVFWALDAQSPVFELTAACEHRHTAMVAGLLRRCGYRDPTAGLGAGQFTTSGATALYAEMVARGARSTVDALRVGAALEERELADLERARIDLVSPEVVRAFEQLIIDARNQREVFVGQLALLGEPYILEHDAAAWRARRSSQGPVAP